MRNLTKSTAKLKLVLENNHTNTLLLMRINKIIITICLSLVAESLLAQTTMREAFKDKFLIGAAINVRQVNSKDPKVQKVIKEQFSALVPENCMKPEEIHPKQYLWDFSDADAIVKLAQKNKQAITGHCLVWHSQVPYWFFKDDMAQPVTCVTIFTQ